MIIYKTVTELLKDRARTSPNMFSSSKMFALLALMMVGDARAAPAKFADKAALDAAVDACLLLSSVGNCCADNSNPATIVISTGDDQAGECDDGYTHLQKWDVSQVTSMQQSELCVISIDVFPLPFVCCPLSFKVSARVI